MTIKTATFNLLAGALVAGSFVLPFNSASAFGVVGKNELVGKDALVGKNEITTKHDVVAKKNQAPQGYHLQGFRGWDHGYPVVLRGCSPLRAALPGACNANLPIKEGI